MEETEQSSAVSLLEESLPPNDTNVREANNETSSKDVTLLDESNVLNKSFDGSSIQPTGPKQPFRLPTDPEDELIEIDKVFATTDDATTSSSATPVPNEQEIPVDVSTSDEAINDSPTTQHTDEQQIPVVKQVDEQIVEKATEKTVEQIAEKVTEKTVEEVEEQEASVEFTSPSPPLNKTTTRRFKPHGPWRTTISSQSEQQAASTSSSRPILPNRHAKKNCWSGNDFTNVQQIMNEALSSYQKRCELERIMARVEDPEKYQNPFEKHNERVEKFGAIFTVLGVNYVICKFSKTPGQWPAKISDVRKSNQFYELSQHLLRIKNQKSRVIFYN
ncbi:hypothetical protein M3Y97_00015400 [Aphelenchoides bicaudatus]|nr:hypothetical protein M3Y97_00015400 [Aphelenchoides bicaudatus]